MNLYDENGKKIIFLIVGKSASGKSTVVEKLLKYNVFRHLRPEYNPFQEVKSATTRHPRRIGETGHRFVDMETFEKEKDDMLAYTFFNGNHYYTTPKDLDGALFYVIDPKGVDYFKESKHANDYHPIIVWIKCDPFKRIYRLIKRDGLVKGINRWLSDFKEFKDWKRIKPDIKVPHQIADSVIEIEIFGKSMCSVTRVLKDIPDDYKDEADALVEAMIDFKVAELMTK